MGGIAQAPVWEQTLPKSPRIGSPSFGGRAGVRLGIKEEGSVSNSSDQDHLTQHPEDRKMV